MLKINFRKKPLRSGEKENARLLQELVGFSIILKTSYPFRPISQRLSKATESSESTSALVF